MIIKKVGQDQIQQIEELWDYCFEKKSDPFFQYYFGDYCNKHNTVFGCFEKREAVEKLIAMVHVNPYRLRIRSEYYDVPYLVGVATAPEARGRHLFANMATSVFHELKAAGIAFVTLMPIYAGIYQPYGFSFCYFRHEYKLPLTSLKYTAMDAQLSIRRIGLEESIGTLQELYNKLTEVYNGVPVRSFYRWQLLTKVYKAEDVHLAIVYRNEQAAGYMLYKINGETFEVIELLSDSYSSKDCLLAYAANHKSAAKYFCWLAPPCDLTFLSFEDQKLAGSVCPFMMARCLDVTAAMLRLQVPASLTAYKFCLHVFDPIVEDNNVKIKINICDGSLHIKNSPSEAEDVFMDIGAFTQLYMGAFSAEELLNAGRIRCHNIELVRLLNILFPKKVNYDNEYF